MRDQLAMQYRVFINVQPSFSGPGLGLTLYNNSKSEIYLYGVRISNDSAVMNNKGGSAIAEHTAREIQFGEYYSHLPGYRDGDRSPVILPYDLYIKNAAGDEFVWTDKFNFSSIPTQSGQSLQSPNGALRAAKWSETVEFSQAPSGELLPFSAPRNPR